MPVTWLANDWLDAIRTAAMGSQVAHTLIGSEDPATQITVLRRAEVDVAFGEPGPEHLSYEAFLTTETITEVNGSELERTSLAKASGATELEALAKLGAVLGVAEPTDPSARLVAATTIEEVRAILAELGIPGLS